MGSCELRRGNITGTAVRPNAGTSRHLHGSSPASGICFMLYSPIQAMAASKTKIKRHRAAASAGAAAATWGTFELGGASMQVGARDHLSEASSGRPGLTGSSV